MPDLGRGNVVERRVRALPVVVVDPTGDLVVGLVEGH